MLGSARAGLCSSASSKLEQCCWRLCCRRSAVEHHVVVVVGRSYHHLWAQEALTVSSLQAGPACRTRGLRCICLLVGRSTSWSRSRRRLSVLWFTRAVGGAGGRSAAARSDSGRLFFGGAWSRSAAARSGAGGLPDGADVACTSSRRSAAGSESPLRAVGATALPVGLLWSALQSRRPSGFRACCCR